MDFFLTYLTSISTYETWLICFMIAFFINLLWEVIHSQFYITCLEMPLPRYIRTIIWASLKDAFFITLFFLFTVWVYQNWHITSNVSQMTVFVIIAFIFSYVDEKISLQKWRWQYTDSMYTIAGVWVSPLLELVMTGSVTFFIIEYYINPLSRF